MEKKAERKKWPAWKYWTEYLMQSIPKKKWIEICLGKHQTIHHALSTILTKRFGRPYTKEEIDSFAKTLSTGLNQAIKMLWATRNERYVVGIPRIDRITNNPCYCEEHFRRIAHLLDQRRVSAGIKTFGATPEQCREYGLPSIKELKDSSLRLLHGDCDFDDHLKSIEPNIDVCFCKRCHRKFPKPDEEKCPFCQSKNIKIV